MKSIIYTLLILLLLSSCNKKELEAGFAEIIPSLTEYIFDSKGGSITITISGKSGNISELNMFGSYTTNQYGFPLQRFHNFPDLSPEEWDFLEVIEEYIGENESYLLPTVVEIRTDWFDATRRPRDKIVINVQPNSSGRERVIALGLKDMATVVPIYIIQAAE